MDKRKGNGRKPGGCQAILESGEPCKKDGDIREVTIETIQNNYTLILVRVRVCGKCWEGEN